jgi:hypothetical protein
MLRRRIPFNAVQQAMYALLSQGQTIPVYDRIPTGEEPMPYIWLGTFYGTPEVSNKAVSMHRISQQLDIWSDEQGKKEVNGIMDDVAYLLTTYALPLVGYRQIDGADITQYRALAERYADNTGAYHGILIVEYTIEEE